MDEKVKCHCLPTDAVAALLLRLALGSVFFFAGLDKFLGKGGVMGSVDYLIGQFSGSYLPMFLVTPFAYLIPVAEIVLGPLLILGVMTRAVLVASGLYTIGLLIGVLVLMKPDTAAFNTAYVGIIVAALWFASRDNRYSLDHLFGICRTGREC